MIDFALFTGVRPSDGKPSGAPDLAPTGIEESDEGFVLGTAGEGPKNDALLVYQNQVLRADFF